MSENVTCKVLSYIMFRSVVLLISYARTNMHTCTHELSVALVQGMSCTGNFELIFNAIYFYSCLVSNDGCQAGQQNLLK